MAEHVNSAGNKVWYGVIRCNMVYLPKLSASDPKHIPQALWVKFGHFCSRCPRDFTLDILFFPPSLLWAIDGHFDHVVVLSCTLFQEQWEKSACHHVIPFHCRSNTIVVAASDGGALTLQGSCCSCLGIDPNSPGFSTSSSGTRGKSTTGTPILANLMLQCSAAKIPWPGVDLQQGMRSPHSEVHPGGQPREWR